MIGCLVVVQLTTSAVFKQVEFDVDQVAEAERMAAIHAGQLSVRQGDNGSSRFGFKCQDRQWVSVDLTWEEVFGDSRRVASKPNAG